MKNIILLAVITTMNCFAATAQEESAAQANNPLANMTALNFHNYYIPKLTDAPSDAYLNTTWIRFAKSFAEGKLLFRLSVPMNTVAQCDGLGKC